jgi:DNA repair exonuclease SbcCD ATPase subunit
VDVMDAASTSAPPEPVSVEPAAPGTPTPQPEGEERVLIGRYSVPLAWALSCGRGDCRDCSGKGWIERVDQRGVRVLCHRCVMPRATRRLDEQMRAAQQLHVPLAAPGPDAAEQERHQRKVSALRRQLAELEDELTRRGVRHERAVEAERQACGALIAAEQEASTRVLVQSVKVDTLREEVVALEKELGEEVMALEKEIATRRRALNGSIELLASLRREHETAQAQRAALESPVQRADERFQRDTAGLRKEIARARRRLDLALARWSPREGEGDAAPSGQVGAGGMP